MKHFVANPIISVHADTASAQSYVLVISSGATVTVTLAGRYEDQLAKQTGPWQRTVRFDLMAPT